MPVSDRGIVIKESDPVIRRLIFQSDSDSGSESETTSETAKKKPITLKQLPPSPNQKTVQKFNRLLREHRKPNKPKTQILTGEIVNPQNLAPIHLRKDPLPSLSPRTRTFAIKNGAGNIVKSRELGIKAYQKKCDLKHRLPRKKSIFVDDSAIEDDGFGGDIKSTTTTPCNTPPEVIIVPDSPVKPLVLPPNQARTQGTTQDLPPVRTIHKPQVTCDICGTKASSKYQIAQHQKGKKCRAKAARLQLANKNLFCSTCKFCFKSLHDFHNHKCRKNRKH